DEIIRRGGLKVYSTLDARMQKTAEMAMTNGLRALDKRAGYRGPLYRPNAEQAKKLKERFQSFKKQTFIADNGQNIWDLSGLAPEVLTGDFNQVVDNIRLSKLRAAKIVGAMVVAVNDQTQMATIDLGSRMAVLPISLSAFAHVILKDGKRLLLTKISDALKPNDIVLVKIHTTDKQPTVSLEQEPDINGGLVALDAKTGGALAMVGGYDFERSPFNRVTQAKRQLGSGIKPLVYGYAIDRKLATAAKLIPDMPKVFLDPGTNEFWRPRNHTNEFLGDITFRRCLRSSVNICTITLLEMIGIDNFLQLAKDVELNTPYTPYPRNLTIALGSAENYPIDAANAMRIFANHGRYSDYHLINAIRYADGRKEKVFDLQEKQVISPEAAFVITNILKEVVEKSRAKSKLNDVKAELAGKTGTTNNARSTWFFGYSPKVLALVYVGYDDNRSIGVDAWGRTTAKPIWEEFMNGVAVHKEDLRFTVPDNIEWHMVDRESGRPLSADMMMEMPSHAIMEAFIAGTVPKIEADANIYRAAPKENDEAAFAP
ncbi:MAG TPA: penicillin-binding transpeptidase domain-containing protein, partial [Myxococcota bacterium]|nr:penicillin-binding transpeptidase domain-containing protein [Myxococcota bacterium]